MNFIQSSAIIIMTAASGPTNTSLRSMDVGLTTAVFGSKTQTAIANKNSDLRRQTNAETKIDLSGRRITVVTTKSVVSTTAKPVTGSGRSSRETTLTRAGVGVGGVSTGVRSEPLRHTLYSEAGLAQDESGREWSRRCEEQDSQQGSLSHWRGSGS